ncbi:uncharacterized protein LOC130015405 [Mercurialis annua]|uniref:uncharacterized protein LOC130015405 n=1 Tax=Mercurialis annua TaxID=3986 RepID=UPI0024AEB364|nr:uncharacterized protein LOC130015405 [Mercurialis annua]
MLGLDPTAALLVDSFFLYIRTSGTKVEVRRVIDHTPVTYTVGGSVKTELGPSSFTDHRSGLSPVSCALTPNKIFSHVHISISAHNHRSRTKTSTRRCRKLALNLITWGCPVFRTATYHPIPDNWEFSDDLPDEDVFLIQNSPWNMYFDGAARQDGAGAGVVFISPEGEVLPYAFNFSQNCSNNVAEYHPLILGLDVAIEMNIDHINVFGDSELVVNQLLSIYKVKKPELIPCFQHASRQIDKFDTINIEHVPRKENKQADALANLAATLTLSNTEVQVPVCKRWVVPEFVLNNDEGDYEQVSFASVYEIEKEDWRQPLIDYLEHGRLPDEAKHRAEVKRRSSRFVYFKDTLYRRSFDDIWLRCLDDEEATKALEEAHSGVCGAHQSGPKLHFHIKRMGYYWPTMPFDAWGLDVVGPLPKSSGEHLYILSATDYFSKWAEAAALKEVKKEVVVNFIKNYIIFRHGTPRYIITDNGKEFSNKAMDKLCVEFKFKQYNASMYNAPANGLAEAFNKTLCSLLKKNVSRTKRDWHERLGEALCAYRTTHRTATGATPYSLVYGTEAVLPLECQVPSLRIAIQEGLSSNENARLRLEELEALDEKRLEAQQRLECYQARMSKAFNKKVRPRSFQLGDLVLAIRRPKIISRRMGNKFLSNWDGLMLFKKFTLMVHTRLLIKMDYVLDQSTESS